MQQRRSLAPAAVLAAVLLLLLPATATAAISSCTLSATTVAFGVFSGTQRTTTGTITVTCRGAGTNNPFSVALSTGSGTYATRTMKSGTNSLPYNLYTDLAHTIIWGNGTGGTQVVSGRITFPPSPISVPETVFGLLPAQPIPVPGSYLDTIIATVTF